MNSPKQHEDTLAVINQLYAAEKHSLLPRLGELNAFVEWAFALEMEQVRRMIADQACHESWLIDAADRCGGVLLPAPVDAGTANLHYLDLRVLLPRVIESVEQLVRTYDRALAESGALSPHGSEIISRIQRNHQEHLQQLKSIHARLQNTRAQSR